jgi:hypothetical protein
MAKNVLVLYYTQSGQLEEILSRMTDPLTKAGHHVEMLKVQPVSGYPFPWTSDQFFSVMPASVLGQTEPLASFQWQESRYDLVILGYQPWFLSPSIPVNSLLHEPRVEALLRDCPVITVTGARNMWIQALERIKARLRDCGARQVGNIALTDRHANLISVVTILYWMFSGKKDRFLNLFPEPGVSGADIGHSSVFGELVAEHLQTGKWEGLQEALLARQAVQVNYNLMYTEQKAVRLFRIWADFIVTRKNRRPWLAVFKYYLIIALFIAAPIILTLHTLCVRPFLTKRIKKQIAYYSGIN